MPKLKLVSILARCRGPGWVAIARHYEHETGPFKIWTIGEPGQADVVLAGKIFDWLRFWYERDRVLAREKAERRKQRRAQRRKGEGKPKRPPAAPRGGGKAA